MRRSHHDIRKKKTYRAIADNSTNTNRTPFFRGADTKGGISQGSLDRGMVVSSEAYGFHYRLKFLDRRFPMNNRHAHTSIS